MDGTKFNRRFLKMLLKMQCEKETLDCVIHEMRAVLGEKMPEEDAVRAYLKDPGKKQPSQWASRSLPWTSCWKTRR